MNDIRLLRAALKRMERVEGRAAVDAMLHDLDTGPALRGAKDRLGALTSSSNRPVHLGEMLSTEVLARVGWLMVEKGE